MFNVNYHLKGELVSLCNIPANWAKSLSDFFLPESILAYFFLFKTLSSALGKS